MLEKLKYLVPVVAMTMALLFVSSITSYQLNSYAQAQEAPQVVSTKERMRELECLARNIYFESASEPFEGKVAVAQVTINRVNSGQFASSICAVVYQKNVVYEKVICQFSWYCESPSTLKVRSPELYRESMEVAKKVLLEGFRLPSLNQALYFHADYIKPGWGRSRVKLAQIGRHIFYM